MLPVCSWTLFARQTEVIFLRRLRHPHLVGFVGYCTEEEQGVLVYEYMANGSLDKHLFDGMQYAFQLLSDRVLSGLEHGPRLLIMSVLS